VAVVNTWLIDFSRDNADVVDGRGYVTATSIKRGPGGVIFFTVFILTIDPSLVEAMLVELPAFNSSVGDTVLSEPQPCEHGELVGLNDAEI
jgi:hypothetical protein